MKSMSCSSVRVPFAALASTLMVATVVWGQVGTLPDDFASDSQTLWIGPITGLTTAWHEAPLETGIPVGTTVQLKQDAPANAVVTWVGADPKCLRIVLMQPRAMAS